VNKRKCGKHFGSDDVEETWERKEKTKISTESRKGRENTLLFTNAFLIL